MTAAQSSMASQRLWPIERNGQGCADAMTLQARLVMPIEHHAYGRDRHHLLAPATPSHRLRPIKQVGVDGGGGARKKKTKVA